MYLLLTGTLSALTTACNQGKHKLQRARDVAISIKLPLHRAHQRRIEGFKGAQVTCIHRLQQREHHFFARFHELMLTTKRTFIKH